MAEKTLPESPELPLDRANLQSLIRDALLAAWRNLNGTKVDERPSLVYSLSWKDGPKYLGEPDYRSAAVWARLAEIWKSEEAEKLTDYLWSTGWLKKKLWSDDPDNPPTKDGWARFVWEELIHRPLLHLLWLTTTADLSTTGTYRLWHIESESLEEAASDLADRVCNKNYTVVAICPVIALRLTGEDRFTFTPELVLEKWKPEENISFFTRYHYYYVEDMMYGASDAVIKLRLHVSSLDESEALDLITEALDGLKWACLIAADTDSVFEEGTIIITNPSGHGLRQSLRRGEVFFRRKGFKIIGIEKLTANKIADLLQRLRKLAGEFPEINSALWYFGRACVAPLARDVLLDAVVGLEMILVPDPGESTYKFGLHGAALLSPLIGKPPSDLVKELKDIYGLRSKAAHGSVKDSATFEKLAPRARLLLAKVILATVELTESGKLDLKATKGDIGKAVVQLVCDRAAGIESSPSDQVLDCLPITSP